MCEVHVAAGGTTKQLPLVVCKGNGLLLLGRNLLQELRLNWQEIAKIYGITKSPADILNELLTQYADVFKPGLGHCKDVKAKLYLKEGAVPKFNHPRPTALAMKPKVEDELNRQEELGVLEKVDTAEWSAPVVPVVKPTYWSHSFMWGLQGVSESTLGSKQVPPTPPRGNIYSFK